jgi:diacylglycerol O-acyltransferase
MKLNPLDYLFLRMETPENPAHVALLAIYEIPRGYRGNFVRELRQRLLANTTVSSPFNQRLKPQGMLPGWYEWERDANLDLQFHVRHSALPRPGKASDLMELVSRLHARLLDRSRPLWECYLIEGLRGRRFATYTKMHHAMIDGAGGMEILEHGLTTEPDPSQVLALWNPAQESASKSGWPGLQRLLLSVPASLLKQALAVPQAAYAILAPSLGLKKTAAGKPFRGGKTMFNTRVGASRVFGTGCMSLEQVRMAGKALGATVNDIFLCACAGALNKYMTKRDSPPGPEFSAAVPVAMARQGGSNAIAYILVALHPEIADPIRRLAAISASSREAKHDQADLSRTVINTMTLMAQGAQAALGQLGLAELLPPAAGLVISNVSGMNQERYLMGARLTALYPMSVLIHAQGLNITVLSYCGELQYGLLSTPDIAPDVQHLADLIGKEFNLMRAAVAAANGDPPAKPSAKRTRGRAKKDRR